jgi:hypothetical protein
VTGISHDYTIKVSGELGLESADVWSVIQTWKTQAIVFDFFNAVMVHVFGPIAVSDYTSLIKHAIIFKNQVKLRERFDKYITEEKKKKKELKVYEHFGLSLHEHNELEEVSKEYRRVMRDATERIAEIDDEIKILTNEKKAITTSVEKEWDIIHQYNTLRRTSAATVKAEAVSTWINFTDEERKVHSNSLSDYTKKLIEESVTEEQRRMCRSPEMRAMVQSRLRDIRQRKSQDEERRLRERMATITTSAKEGFFLEPKVVNKEAKSSKDEEGKKEDNRDEERD